MTAAPGNRPISAFVAGFAAASLLASVLPLLQAGSGESLVPMFGRDAGFLAYVAFLLLFAFFFVPAATLREGPGKRLGPWWVLTAFCLLFSAVPAVVAAYISGVARPQVLCVAGGVAACCAGALLLRAWFGVAGAVAAFAAGGALLFSVPAVDALCHSLGVAAPRWWSAASIPALVHRLVILRAPIDPAPFLVAAGALWVLVVVAAFRGARRRAPALLLVATLLCAIAAQAPGPDVTIEPLAGGAVRAGARTPVAITARGGRPVEVAFRTATVRVPGDGVARTALVVPSAGETEVEALSGGARARVAVPFRIVEPDRPLLGVPKGGDLAARLRVAVPHAACAEFDLDRVPALAGALEGFDAVVLDAPAWAAVEGAVRNAILAYAGLAGTVVIVGGGAESRDDVPGIVRVAAESDLAGRTLRRAVDPDFADATLRGLFARPDWQALDLTRLVWFLVGYHIAFLLAFLLPLLLDSHKARAVYLVSVGSVLAVVVAGAWWSLRQFFLRDNQVYTQALTFISVPARGDLILARQFRSYASMSGESRDLPWPGSRDLVAYRDAATAVRVLDLSSPPRLDDVWLDRFHAKVVVREDVVARAPIAIEEAGGRFRIRPVGGVDDPLGLRIATPSFAFVLERDGTTRAAQIQGGDIESGPPVEPSAAAGLDGFARALLGRFLGRPAARTLVLRVRGVRRLDDTGDYFQTSDLDSVVAIEIPGDR